MPRREGPPSPTKTLWQRVSLLTAQRHAFPNTASANFVVVRRVHDRLDRHGRGQFVDAQQYSGWLVLE